jgi:hypothetical protein
MPVVSGYLTVDTDQAVHAGLCSKLAADGRITLGDPMKNLLPLVVTSTTVQEDRDIWKQIAATDGVIMQQIVQADFQDLYDDTNGGIK